MNKSLIAISIATLVGMVGAHAEVTVFGQVDMSYGKNETTGDTKDNIHSGGDKGSSEGCAGTKLGFKGSTDVGPGVKAAFRLESGGITSDGEVNPGGAFFDGDAWVGLSGTFGEFRVGRQNDVPQQVMGDFDFNGGANATSAQMLARAAPWSTPGRQSRSLQYIAPEVAGLRVQVGFQPESDDYGTPKAKASDNKNNYALGGSYQVDRLVLGMAAESARTDALSDFYSAAASYDFGPLKAEIGYANGGTGLEGPNVGVVLPILGFTVGLTYADSIDSEGASATEFYINREVYKNTSVYFDYASLSDKSGEFLKGEAYALGMVYTF